MVPALSPLTAEATLPVDGAHSGRCVDELHDTVLTVGCGVVCVRAGDDEHVLTPGETLTIPAGVAHRYWNAGDEEARVVCASRALVPVALPRAA